MKEKQIRDVPDPLALAARVVWRGTTVKSLARATGVPLTTARNWIHHIARIPVRLRGVVARAIEAEMDRQEAGERADSRAACRDEIMRGTNNGVTGQTVNGHAEMDCAAHGGWQGGPPSDRSFI
jgi:hypothetical protein